LGIPPAILLARKIPSLASVQGLFYHTFVYLETLFFIFFHFLAFFTS